MKIRHSGLMIKNWAPNFTHVFSSGNPGQKLQNGFVYVLFKIPPKKVVPFNDPETEIREFWKETFAIKVFWKYPPEKLTNSLSLKPLFVNYLSGTMLVFGGVYIWESICRNFGWIFAASIERWEKPWNSRNINNPYFFIFFQKRFWFSEVWLYDLYGV